MRIFVSTCTIIERRVDMHHNMCFSWEVLWKEAGSIPYKDLKLYCICTHPRRKAAKALLHMYPCRILIIAKGVQMLQPLYWEGSRKLGCGLWRIDIMVQTRTNSPEPTPPKQIMIDFEVNPNNDEQLRAIAEESTISTRLNGPQEPLSDWSMSQSSPKMDKGKSKC